MITLTIFLELSIQQIAILCPFSADRSSELIKRKKFSDIYRALQYRICLEWSYIHVLSKNSSFRDNVIVTLFIFASNHGHIPLILIL